MFKQKIDVNEMDEQQIFLNIISRRRFFYSTRMIFEYLFTCLCLRNIKGHRHQRRYKNHIYYDHAEKALMKELDVVTLIKSIKNLRLIC